MSSGLFPVDLPRLDAFGEHHAGGVIGLTLLVTEWNYNAIDPKQLYWLLKGVEGLEEELSKLEWYGHHTGYIRGWKGLWKGLGLSRLGISTDLTDEEKRSVPSVFIAAVKRVNQMVLRGDEGVPMALARVREWFIADYDDIPYYFRDVAWDWIVEYKLMTIPKYYQDDILKLYVISRGEVPDIGDSKWTAEIQAMSQAAGLYFLVHGDKYWDILEDVSHVEFIDTLLMGWYVIETSPERHLNKVRLDERLRYILSLYPTIGDLPTTSLTKDWDDLEFIRTVYNRLSTDDPYINKYDTIFEYGIRKEVIMKERVSELDW